jgi:elongation factor Ts
MMAVTTEQIKKLRDITGAGVLDCREALTQAKGDFEKAVDFLREKGLAMAAKRASRDASDGVVELYSHGDGRVGVMVEVNCETDFVSRNESFRKFAHEIALQVAAESPLVVKEDEVTEEALELVREDARIQAKGDGKSDKDLDQIVEDHLEKYKDEVVLLRQPYIRDESITVQDILNDAIVSIGENIVIRRFERWELGEITRSDAEQGE